MKKITMLVAALGISTFLSAQTVLSHSTDNSYMESGSVACASDPDQVPGSGDEYSSDNIYYRTYTPSTFGISGGFEVQGANFWVSFQDYYQNDPDFFVTLRFYSVVGTFPSGTLLELESQLVQVSADDAGTKISVTLDNPFVVGANQELIVAVDFPEADSEAGDNFDARIGINGAGENSPSYLSSVGCEIAQPTAAGDLGNFPNNNILLDVVGTEAVLSVQDIQLSQVAVYPNPTTGILNVQTPSSVDVNSVALFDVLGKKVNADYGNGTINMTSLSQGIYLLKVETSVGTLTQKIVKQ